MPSGTSAGSSSGLNMSSYSHSEPMVFFAIATSRSSGIVTHRSVSVGASLTAWLLGGSDLWSGVLLVHEVPVLAFRQLTSFARARQRANRASPKNAAFLGIRPRTLSDLRPRDCIAAPYPIRGPEACCVQLSGRRLSSRAGAPCLDPSWRLG